MANSTQHNHDYVDPYSGEVLAVVTPNARVIYLASQFENIEEVHEHIKRATPPDEEMVCSDCGKTYLSSEVDKKLLDMYGSEQWINEDFVVFNEGFCPNCWARNW